MNTPRTLMAAAASLALNIGTIATGFATTSDEGAMPRVVVRYAESELATAEGVRHVQHRILSAVARVCPAPDTLEVERWVPVEACRAQALAEAVAQVKSPQLAAVLSGSAHQI
jgi:UrcA family protein